MSFVPTDLRLSSGLLIETGQEVRQVLTSGSRRHLVLASAHLPPIVILKYVSRTAYDGATRPSFSRRLSETEVETGRTRTLVARVTLSLISESWPSPRSRSEERRVGKECRS